MPSTKTLEKTIKKAAKSVLVSQGIDVGNRRGNKELDFIARKIASVSSGDLQDAEEKGQKLGEKISELSEQRGKKNLDRGVVRQVALEGEFFPIAKSNRKAALPTTVKSDPLATSTTEPDREPVPAEDPTAPT
ncbi:hypothetical protein, partial [Baaleninema sp.]|uniref:hypothetical protein n=1 Tax=Baaleninema sp. TaxID=3101197 RepID=UPI003D081C73